MKKQVTYFSLLALVGTAFYVLSSYFDGSQATLEELPWKKAVQIPKGWPKPVYDFEANPLSEEGFQLGRQLFYDPQLSKDNSVSCASCHLSYTGFTHVDHAVSHGINGRKGSRNTLALMNLAWSQHFMWDGGINHIEVQPLAPLESPQEMDMSLAEVVKRISESETYRKRFAKVFGSNKKISGQLVLKALSQYMLSLQSSDSKYDRVIRKEEGYSFTEYEANGYKLFTKHCASCHTEPLFTNGGFANNGLKPDTLYNDGGRIKISGKAEDSLKFKVPTLRNIAVTYPYMHDGRYRNLQMVLFHYSEGIHQTVNLAPQLKKGIKLNENEKRDLIAFLKTLTDTEFLRNPLFAFPRETIRQQR